MKTITGLLWKLASRLPEAQALTVECSQWHEAYIRAEDHRQSRQEQLDARLTKLAAVQDECESLQSEIASVRKELQELTVEKLVLQDRLQVALSDRERVWAVMQDALADKDRALHTQINILMQERYGIAPHPDAPKLPDSRVPQQQEGGPVRRRMSPAEAIERQTTAFVKDFASRVRQDLKASPQ